MLERGLWALVIIAAGVTLYLLLRHAHLAWVRRRMKPAAWPDGKPTLLYFSTPGCAPCWSLQAPAVAQVEGELGEALCVVRVDALLQPDEAARWGVLSVPTTIILDPRGEVRYLNHGYVTAEVLKRQINTLDGGRKMKDGFTPLSRLGGYHDRLGQDRTGD